MDIQTNIESDGTRATLRGEADADNCHLLGEALLEQDVVASLDLDMSAVTFLDSSAISELLRVQRTLAERDVAMTISSPSPAVLRVLEITGLLEIFGVSDT